MILVAGRPPGGLESLAGPSFRSRKAPKDFPASKNWGWQSRERRQRLFGPLESVLPLVH